LYPAGATPEGVQDMAGNVLEWVDVSRDSERKLRVLRGGAFSSDAQGLRATERLSYGPGGRNYVIGFRLAREVVVP
jgi:formylglycine-generating enzyme required for sulfatase activity